VGIDAIRLLALARCSYDRVARWPAIFIAVSIIAFMILGSVLEGIPAIVLFGPLLFPIAKTVGVHEVHYAMIVILAMGIGLFAPPFGVGYYAACAIGRVDPAEGSARFGAICCRCWSA
jgi:TRAP-type C4-dicarboxylate transport system permease large subunit